MAVCRVCGSELPEGARFCPACGARAEVARRGEERKIVTVLFADLVGSTSFAAERDPEDVRAVLRPYFARARAELERFGGTFEKFIGDAVMALFGAPSAHEDDPERAVRAALAIRDAFADHPEIEVRIAVNTGEAVVSLDARPEEGEGMAAGDVVNTAFRIQESARPGGVLVGEATYRGTRGAIEYGEATLVDARGKSEPIRVREALRARTPLRAAYEGQPLAPLVGRRVELNLILDTIARARRDSSPQLVTVIGVPGIGKSRLVWELFRALESETGLVTWRRGRCVPYGEGITFWALGEMAKAQAGILDTDGREEAEAKLRRAALDLIPDQAEAEWVEAHLRPLIGLGGDKALGADRREDAFAAWRRFFEALAEWGPLVLVFEDIHWADEGLLDFIDHLADWARDSPLVLLCTARPDLHERRRGWGARPNAASIALAPLSREETAQLVGLLLKQPVLPVELQTTLLERAEGNPLYAEEFVRMLVDRGFLRREGEVWHLRDGDLPLPESVQGIIAARLDALAPQEKSLLQDAAVVGRIFWAGALAAMSEEERDAIEQRLHGLERKELVRRVRASSVADEPEYIFHHVLVRDAAYAQIPRGLRVEKHCLAAEWFESLGRPEDHAEMLAHHYLSALDFAAAAGRQAAPFAEPARRALREAGERALALNAFPAATRYFGAALDLWPEDAPDRPELLSRYVRAGFEVRALGDQELAGVRDELLAAGRTELAAEVESQLGLLIWTRGEGQQALDHLRKAVELVASRPASPSKAFALVNLANALYITDRQPEALVVARDAMEMATELDLPDVRARALRIMGTARALMSDIGGLEDLERSVEVAHASGSAESDIAYYNLAGVHVYLGDLEAAFGLQDAARREVERFGDARIAHFLEGERVNELYWRGRWDDALAKADMLIAESEQGEPHYTETHARFVRGHIRLARGRDDGALADATRALEAGRRAGDFQLVAPALGFRARVLLAGGAAGEAGELVDELLERLEPSRILPAALAWTDLSCVLVSLGRGPELTGWARQTPLRTRWLAAALAFVAGDFVGAADLYAEIGSRPDEAYARLLAGLAGDRDQLSEALDFFRAVDAVRYTARAEAALASAG
jgi:class 3 adenylate cyclase/tetratricopeptide (TPR) repeat protein